MSTSHELLFITVPPPRSGNIVEFLADLQDVVEAVAVYTDIDVIALVKRNDNSVTSTISKIENLGSPIENVERCKIDDVIDGPTPISL